MTDPEYFPADKVLVPPGTLLDTLPQQAVGVRSAFEALRQRPERIGSWDMDRIPHPAYTFQNVGNGETRTHFQGIQRLGKHPYLVVSGGDRLHSVSHLFLVECQPRTDWGPLGSNLWKDPRSPPGGDRLRRIIGIDRARWHAGGISVLGDIVAVPLEGSGFGQIVFLDLSDPMNPRWAPTSTTINADTPAAGAVALTRAPNGQFLVAVWRDEREGEPAGRLDFYISTNAVSPSDQQTPFEPLWQHLGPWVYSAPAGSGLPEKPHYQGITWVWEHGGTDLYLIGTRNSSLLAPNLPGEDWADLYHVAPPAGMVAGGAGASGPAQVTPVPVYVTSCRLRGADEFCSFAGGGGAFVSGAGALLLYGAFHFRGDGLFRMSEFWGPGSPAATWWVELYERTHFEGRRLALFGEGESRIDDYKDRFAQGQAFDDTVISARFRLPVGVRYRLFEKPGCPNNPPAKQFVDLVGTGGVAEVERLDQLKPGFGRKVRSSAVRTP